MDKQWAIMKIFTPDDVEFMIATDGETLRIRKGDRTPWVPFECKLVYDNDEHMEIQLECDK